MPFLPPNQQRQSTDGTILLWHLNNMLNGLSIYIHHLKNYWNVISKMCHECIFCCSSYTQNDNECMSRNMKYNADTLYGPWSHLARQPHCPPMLDYIHTVQSDSGNILRLTSSGWHLCCCRCCHCYCMSTGGCCWCCITWHHSVTC